MKKWTKRKLKTTKYVFTPSDMEFSTGGYGGFAPDGRGVAPSGINYLEDKFEVQENLIFEESRLEGFLPRTI